MIKILTAWQTRVFEDTHRFKVVCAGRRSGKSVLSRLTVLNWAAQNKGLYWIVSPTYIQGKDIHWLQGFKIDTPPSIVEKWNDADLSLTLKNGSVIQLKSAENPDRLKGVKLRGLVVDEIAAMRNWNWIWHEALRPTLTDYQAPAVFISTPRGFNHFYELFNETNENYKAWRFTSYDNPYVKKEEIESARKELAEDTFQQEYMADFRKYTGLIYKEFDRGIHVIEPFDIPSEWQTYRGVDFGSTNPTACLWIAVDGDENWFICDEHYETGQTIDYHAGIINSKKNRNIVATYGDPSGAQWISEFAQRGIYITPANKEQGQSTEGWVRFGIEKVAEKIKCKLGHVLGGIGSRVLAQNLSRGMPSLFIFSSCENTIREFETYRWKEKKANQAQDLNALEQPEKSGDHAMDALRYFAVSYKQDINKNSEYDKYATDSSHNWRIGS